MSVARKPIGLGSMLRPLRNLKYLTREPVTLPMEPRPAAENYRGFHVNDWEACIGCGTCSTICDNRAIRMVHVPDLPEDTARGIKPRRPAIDYGRCCWCALCVDVCPTGSLALSREYVHVSDDLDSFFILPDAKGIHGQEYPKGWAKSDHADLLDHERQPMSALTPEERVGGFDEIVQGFDAQTALLEASRCIQCGMCHDACPTHMNAPEYIRAIWSGDLEQAVAEIYRTNPLGQVCGRVCTHRCETACSMRHRGEPIAIRWLKRYALDNLDPARIREIAGRGRVEGPSGRRIAIVGSGPAGLTAAYDLARQGHAVTVFEALPEPGGMMRYGMPGYRMPPDRLAADLDPILALGVELRCGVRIGQDLPFEQLRAEHDAVLLAVGLHLGRSTRVPGSDHPGVVSAVDLLKDIAHARLDVPRSAVVIGGGNVAMDAARSLARLQTRTHGHVDVTVTTLEAEGAFLADEEEIVEAREEGVVILPGRGPRAMVIEDGALKGLESVRCLSIFDDDGRFHPRYDDSDLQFHAAERVVEAIGQGADLGFLGEALIEALEWRGPRLAVDAAGRSSEPWLWAAGDLVGGPDVVHAIAAGHRAAAGIQALLAETATAGSA